MTKGLFLEDRYGHSELVISSESKDYSISLIVI